MARLLSLVAATLAAVSSTSLTAQYELHRFEKKQLSDQFFCEGATFGDLNRDGHADIIAGPYWYAGPDFAQKREIYEPKPFDTAGYSNNFFAFVQDFDGDGWNDVLVIGFPGKDASWFANPRGADQHWVRHQVFDIVDNESPAFTDLTGDGKPELVCQTGDRMGWAAPDWSDPAKPWPFHPISKTGIGGRFTHGLGIGDVDGDGRMDVLARHGWWQQPESLDGDPEWTYHEVQFAGRGGAQMYVYDIDGDGDNDVVSSQNAHGFGLSWFEQQKENGEIRFVKHVIMGNRPEDNPYGVVIGNLHAIDLVDIDGDGLRDIVTGSRYWAHGGHEVADRKPPYLFWFQLVRASRGQGAHFVPEMIDAECGVGTQVVAGDFTGDAHPDVVVGNKKGTFVLIQKVRSVSRSEWYQEQRRQISEAMVSAPQPVKVVGELPVDERGESLNTNFETGDLTNWTATGTAFRGMPNEGDTVYARRDDFHSDHAGKYWVGTFEVDRSDTATGTLTSDPFVVRRPWASFLVAGGATAATRVELERLDRGEVFYKASGRNNENLERKLVDLRELQGVEIRIRLVDEASGGWGHINFDDFLLHAEKPKFVELPKVEVKEEQKTGYLPAEAAHRMTLPEGFRVDVVAAEPDLQQPIALTIDERGRLWVAEAFSYPQRRPDGEGQDKVVVFEDADGDGTFEKRVVFAEGLNLVSGLEVGFSGVWVGAAPYLLFIPDRNHDLVADGPPEVLLDGWGYQDTHETLNAFTWGPDGWLYGCHGVFTHSEVGKPGTPEDQRVKINAGVWRYHPTRREFEVFAWGTSNPWGVDFNDQGQAFITACVIPHLFHVIQGGRFRRQSGRHFGKYVFDDIKTIADHLHYLGSRPHAGNGVSDSVGGGHAHCGNMIYLGDAFPEKYRNTLFVNNIHGNRVNNEILERRGSGYVGKHGKDFLLANDQWFRGINLKYGPDGNVYLIDWYDKQACHHKDPEVWDRTNGRLYAIRYGKPRHLVENLAAKSSLELAALQLRHNDWYVRTARRLLQERGPDPEVHAALAAILRDNPDGTRKLRALWALHVTGGLTDALAMQSLGSEDEYVRAWTVQLMLEDRQVADYELAELARMARTDPSPVVRLYLASALQRLPLDDRWAIAEGLLGHAEDATDHNLPLMIWYGIEPLVPADPTRALALVDYSRIPKVSRFVLRRLASGDEPALDLLTEAILGGDDARRAMIAEEMVRALEKRRDVGMPKSWSKAFDLLAAGPARDAAITLSVLFGDREVYPLLRQIVADHGQKVQRRQRALDDLLRAKDTELLPVLQSLLDDRDMCAVALRGLASYDDAKTPQLIVKRFGGMASDLRQDAVQTLISRSSYATAMLNAIVDKTLPADILDSATTRRDLANLKDETVDKLLEAAWGRSASLTANVQQELERYQKMLSRKVLDQADLSNGRAIFARTCMVCHTLFGVGGTLGPNLTGSNRADVSYILTNILDPNAEVAREYMVTTVETTDGRIVSGFVTDENDDTITLRNISESVTVARKDIALEDGEPKIWHSNSSLMPPGQLMGLSDDETRDLIAYLGSSQQVPVAARPWTLGMFFNGKDLTGWTADPDLWSVEDGEIVGRTTTDLDHNEFAVSGVELGDFRLIVKVKLVDDVGNSGIQFRSEPLGNGGMRGYQADVGPGWWGKLYEEHGRALLWDKSGEAFVKKGEWNTYEVVAVADRILTAINGHPSVTLEDPEGARRGVIGLQLHAGGPTEVRFKDFALELDPEPVLKTVQGDE